MGPQLKEEWESYWAVLVVAGDVNLASLWKGMKIQLPRLATLVICTLSIPHAAADVECCNSYYNLARSDKQHKQNEKHHLGRLIDNFIMNGIVGPILAV